MQYPLMRGWREEIARMATKLNQDAFEHAKQLIAKDHVVLDERDEWSEHQPTTHQENRFIKDMGIGAYAQWYLGVDDENPRTRKSATRSPMATSNACIVVASYRLKEELLSTNITTLNRRRRS
jgi:hypothetical protein